MPLDLSAGVLRGDAGPVVLTRNELGILRVLLERRGQVVRRADLMTALWATDCYVDENTLTVNVARLRKKLEAAGVAGLIFINNNEKKNGGRSGGEQDAGKEPEGEEEP